MKKEVFISVCIAVYNMEKFLEKCLDSVLEQDYDDYEIILIDNGSDDGSIEICERYSRKYPQIISFYTLPKPTELGRAYYECFRKMNGLYNLSVDADDYLCPGALKNIAAAIDKSGADLIMGTFICDVEEGEINFKDAQIDAHQVNDVPFEQAVYYMASLDNFHTVQWRFIQKIQRSNTLVSHYNDKSGYEIHGLFGRFGDTYNVIEILSNAASIYYMDEPFYVYRRRKGSITGERISEDIIVDYLKLAVSFLAVIEQLQLSGKSALAQYARKQQDVKFSLFKYSIHLLSPETKDLVCRVLLNNELIFRLCPVYGNADMQQMYQYMETDGLREGLERYMKTVDNRILQKVRDKKDAKIVIFPTGTMAASLEKLLQQNGIGIEAYIDNDEKKNGKEFYGKTCYLPFDYVQGQKDCSACFYIIATIYKELRIKLKEQLLGYGIPEENIMIWD